MNKFLFCRSERRTSLAGQAEHFSIERRHVKAFIRCDQTIEPRDEIEAIGSEFHSIVSGHGDQHVGDELAFALQVERQRSHVHIFAIARQDIGQRDGHVERLNVNLEVLPSGGVLIVEDRLEELPPRFRVESQQSEDKVRNEI